MNDGPATGHTRGIGGTAMASEVSDRARGWKGEAVTLVLSDGEVFTGTAFGARPSDGVVSGPFEVSTVMSGYQEVVSDPEYSGNIVVFTYPQIGNVGVNVGDDRGAVSGCRGVVVRDLTRITSNWQADGDLDGYLALNGVSGITGVDTRRLVRHLRDSGPLGGAFGTAGVDSLTGAARSVEIPGADQQ